MIWSRISISFLMMLIKKIAVLGGLVCCFLLLPGEIAWGQDDQSQPQSPSTPDLESQPNTYHYPTAPRRRRFSPNQTPTDPQPNPDSPANNVDPNGIPRTNPNFRQQTVPAAPTPAFQAAPSNRTANPAAANPVNRPPQAVFNTPGKVLIGPPAPFPQTPEQMTPAPPKISYENGLLSVESVNARLVDILNGIKAKTGIQFEGIQTTTDRVAGKFGPAPTDEVLTNLLQGSRYDYVIIGQPEHPSLVQRVILSPNAVSAAAAGAAPAVQQPSADDEENSDDSANETAASEQVQGQGSEQPPQPGRPSTPTAPKSAEQLLQELRQMQQQNQQQNQQNPPQQNPPPAPLKPGAPR